MVGVVDAKDVYDKITKDTSSHGQQRSLAFTIAWLRQHLRAQHFELRWTGTENMLVDALTKAMDTEPLRRTLAGGYWSIKYDEDILKNKKTKITPKVLGSQGPRALTGPGSTEPAAGSNKRIGWV